MKQRKGKFKNKKKKVEQPIIKKKKIIQKKDHIFFKYGIGHVLFFQRQSNVFIVLKTQEKKHVITLTGGSCHLGNTKKQKTSPYNVNILIRRLKEYCKLYDVTRIRFFFRGFINKHYYNIIKYLSLYNLKIIEVGYVLHLPHGNMRIRKRRRI